MNRRTKIVAVAAAVLLTLGAGGLAAASADETPAPAPAPASASASVKEAAALTGTAKLYRPAGDDITFSFDAHLAERDRQDPMKATGTFRFSHYKGDWGGYAKVKVDCLTTGGKVAVVSGTVVETDVKEFRKARVGVTVHDVEGGPDRLGYTWMTADPQKDKVQPCLSGAPFEKVKEGTGDFEVTPWEFVYPTE
ncbi:Repetin [Streptomyces sp. NPDC056144]|uniref:Repetin n=1 Tax=unclassified Streptomyces TaxID=2593676 RepID=UPI0035E14EAB